VTIGAFLAGALPARNSVAAAAMTLFVCAGAYAINDFFDISTDRIAKPRRPLPLAQLAPRAALLFAGCLWAAAAVVAPIAGRWGLAFCGGWMGLLVLYSWKLKGSGIYGHVVVSLVASSGFLLGAGVAGGWGAGIAPACIAFGFHLAREIAKGVADVPGDEAAGIRTLAVRTGGRRALVLSVSCSIAAALVALVPFALKMYGPLYLVPVVGIVYPLVAFCGLRVLRAIRGGASGEAAGRSVAGALKYAMIVGLFALVLAGL
jgi:4-hydroxybenzoate polyprenyltransferase